MCLRLSQPAFTDLTGTATVAQGGTGTTSLTSNGILLGGGTGAISATATGTSGQVLTSNGTSAPTFQALPSSVSSVGASAPLASSGGTTPTISLTGTIPVANGGTGSGTALTPGGILYGNSSTATGTSAAGSSGSVLVSNGASAPSWTATPSFTSVSSSTSISSSTQNLNGATAGTLSLTVPATVTSYSLKWPSAVASSSGQALTSDGSGNLSWTTPNSGSVTSVALSAPSFLSVSGSPITSSGTLSMSLATQTQNTIFAAPNGSTGAPVFRALAGADLPLPSSSTLGGVESIASVSHQWINSISTSGVPSLSQPAFTDLTGTATVAQGGTGTTSLTSNGILLGGGTGAISATATGTSGQVLTSNGTSAPTFQALPSSVSSVGASAPLASSGGTTPTISLTGTIPVANGGTGSGTALTPGGILYGNSSTATGTSAAGSAGNVLVSNGASAPSWTATPSFTSVSSSTSISSSTQNLNGATAGTLSLTVPATVTSYSLKWPSAVASSAGQALTSDGSGNLSWTTPNSGSVTSVALSAPSFLSVSGSPITSSGTLSMSLATQTQNTIFAAPNGSTGAPVFRALAGADLPNPSSSTLGGIESIASVSHQWINSISTSGVPSLSQPAFTDLTGTATVAQGGTGTTSLTSNGILLGGGTGAISATATGTSGQVLTSNGTSAPTFQALPSSVSSVGASAPLASSGGTTPTISLTGTIPVANGGTGSGTALTPGGVLYGSSATASGSSAAGSAGNVLISNGTSAPSWTATPSFTSISAPSHLLTGATSGTLTMNVPATVTSYSLKWPSAVASSGQALTSDASGNLSWTTLSNGTTSVGALDGQTANSNGLTISGTSIYAQSASASNPGLVNTATQTLAGAKTFSSALTASNGFSVTSGNVGIGTSSTSPMSILGISNWGVIDVMGNGSNAESSVGFHSSNISKGSPGQWLIGTNIGSSSGANNFAILSQGNSIMTMQQAGNVGIGTATPAYTLDISGTGHISGAVTLSALGTGIVRANSSGLLSSSTLAGADLPLPSSSSLGGVQSLAPTTSKWINSISTSGVPTASQPAFTDISGTATVAQGGTGATSLTSNGILLGGGTGAITATATGSSGQVLTSNGTSAPTFQALPSSVSSVGASAPLASSGGTTPTISLTGTIPVANGGTGSTAALTPGGLLYSSSTTASGTTAAGSSGNVLVSNGASAPSWTTTLNVTSGNVGIGTTSPGGELELFNSTQLSSRLNLTGQEFYNAGNSSTSGIAFLLGVNRTNNRQLWIGDSAAMTQNSTNAVFRLQTNSGGGIVTIDSVGTDGITAKPLAIGNTGANVTLLGNVGIGTTTPNTQFEVASSSGPTLTLNNTGDGSATIQFRTLGGYTPSAQIQAADDGNFAGNMMFSTKTTGNSGTNPLAERMRITSTGNVGIGTTSPSGILDVAGGNNNAMYVRDGSGGNNGTLRFLNSGGTNYIQSGTSTSNSSAPLVFASMNSGTPWMTIASTGNVGIGTTSPAYTLDVSGTGRFTTSLTAPSHLLTGSTSGTLTMAVPATVTSYSLKWPSAVASSAGQALTSDGSGNLSWTTPNSGSVTSVALSAPSFLSVSGSPITSSGTLSMSLATQTQNTIFAAPNGSTGAPVFRALAGADLPLPSSSTLGGVESIASVSHQWINSISTSGVPSLSQPAFTDLTGTATVAQGGTGATSLTSNGILLGGGTGSITATATGTSGQVLTSNGTSAPTFQALPSSVTSVGASAPLASSGGTTPTISLTGTIPVANGGTGSGTALTPGGVLYGSSATASGTTSAGTSGNVLISNGTSAPSWTATPSFTSISAPSHLLTGATSGTLTMNVPATVTSYSLKWPSAVASSGQALTSDASGNLSWTTLSNGTTSVGALDGQTANSNGLTISGTSIYAQSASSSNPGLMNTTTQTLAGAKTFSSLMTGSNGLNVTSGNVGIGTTSPATALQVNGSISQYGAAAANQSSYLQTNASNQVSTTLLNPGILVYGDTLSRYGMDLGYNNSRYRNRIFVPNANDISFATHVAGTVPTAQSSFTELMTIRGDSGNVGIGTTSPAYTLDVSGTGRFTTSLTAPSHLLTGSTSGTLTMAVPATVTSYSLKWPSAVASSAGQALTSDGSGNLSWTTLSSGSVTSVGASAPLASSGGTTPTISLTGTIPVANGGTGTTSLTSNGILLGGGTGSITATATGTSGQVLTSNGTSAPTFQALPSSVSSVGASAPLASSGGTTPTISLTGTIPVANGGTGSGTALTPGGVLYGSSATASGTTSAGTSGNVLISNGTSAPSWTATPSFTSISAPSHLLTGSTSGTLTMTVPATVTSYSLKWPSAVASSAGQVLSSDGSGNLSWSAPTSGITSVGALDGGTANSNGLTISGSSIYAQSASATNAGLVNTTTQTLAGAKTFSSLMTGSSGLNVTSGNVGIGTTSPNNALEIGVSGGALSFRNTSGNYTAVGMTYDSTTDTLQIQSNNGSSQLNRTNMAIARTSGNVGIGTTAPAYNLDVTGTGRYTSDLAVNGIERLTGALEAGGNVLLPNNSGSTGSFAYKIYLAGSNINGSTYDANHYLYSSGSAGNNMFFGEYGGNFNFYDTSANANVMTITGGNVGIGTSSPGGELELFNSTQNSSRLNLTGQEFYNAGYSSTSGIAFLLGVNRTNNRQLWIGDSAAMAQSSSNAVFRLQTNSGGGTVTIDSVGTDGVTAKPLAVGNTGANLTLQGNSLKATSLGGGSANGYVRADTSGNLTSVSNIHAATCTVTTASNVSSISCPANMTAMSGGAQCINGDKQVLQASYPTGGSSSSGPTGWAVSCVNSTATNTFENPSTIWVTCCL